MYSTFSSSKSFGKILVTAIAFSSYACSTFQPPDANGPRSNANPYPVVVTSEGRTNAGLLSWKNLAQLNSLTPKPEPKLNSLTGTIESLPANMGSPIFLPKVGASPTQTEEETRESLRRFINDWTELIGADPSQLSLVERVDEPSGIKVAHYEQRPFRYPLRGSFGNLFIRFTGDRRIVSLSSSCIPNTEKLQAALAALSPTVTAEDAANHVKGSPITITDAAGKQQTFTLAADTAVEVRQLVVYVLPLNSEGRLEFHLAWEIGVPNGSIKTIYLDALTDQVIAGS